MAKQAKPKQAPAPARPQRAKPAPQPTPAKPEMTLSPAETDLIQHLRGIGRLLRNSKSVVLDQKFTAKLQRVLDEGRPGK